MKNKSKIINFSKTIIISKDILSTSVEKKVNFKNPILKVFKNLLGKVAGHYETLSSFRGSKTTEESKLNRFFANAQNNEVVLCQKHAAFTLAETLTVLAIMGVVAALTIPSLYSRHTQSLNRTKIKKAMTVYDAAVKIMKAENKLYNETKFDNFVNRLRNCGNTSKYFIKTAGDGCQFKTSDGIWWDITNIKKPVIAFSQKALNDAIASSADYKNSFYFVSSFDNENILRVNDIGYESENNTPNAQFLATLYDFVNKTEKYSTELANNTSESNTNNSTDPNNTGDNNNNNNDNNDNNNTSPVGNNETEPIAEPEPTPSRDPRLEGYDETCMPDFSYDERSGYLTFGGSVYEGTATLASSSNIGQTECINQRKEAFKKYISTCEGWDGGNGYLFCTDYYCRCACLPYNTLITLADGSTKAVQDIDFNDELKVWDFDNGCLASAKPLWIQEEEIADKYNLLTFSDGRTLKTVYQHRIFNKEAGKYTYPMTDDTPIGTTTLLDDGSEVTLVKKEIIERPVKYYNIITEYHFNLFANGISTSNRFSNMYPIKDLKYVKDDRKMTPYEEFEGIPYEWYEKLRLAEQPLEINKDNDVKFNNSLKSYVIRLINTNKRQMVNV